MFEVITGGNPDDLTPDTRAAVIRAGVRQLVKALDELRDVLALMTLEQRMEICVALGRAAVAQGEFEQQFAAVQRVVKAQSASA